MMTNTTNRIDYIAELSRAADDNPHDMSIKMHLRSVSAMDDAAFEAHRAAILAPVTVVNLAEARQAAIRARRAMLVLRNFEELEHAERRDFLNRKAAVENASRQKL